ncbi:MAG: TatD family nuclease-associated radical SAM protein [Gammaproteobacteria bacterium]|nr:TatD family nuclease-associated radical SAM protein [Gammaproteobacteria bacterium]
MQNQQLSYVIGDSLYLNITDRCTLACEFCPKTQGIPRVHDYDLTLEQRPEVADIIASIGDPARYRQVVFCGFGEPTLRLKVLLEVARYVKSRGGSVRVNTDGLANLFHKRNVLPEMAACVDALSVSLNAQNSEVYDRHCVPALKGSYEAMKEFLRLAPTYIPDTTATAINGLDGVDIAACRKLAEELGVKFRQRELDKVG